MLFSRSDASPGRVKGRSREAHLPGAGLEPRPVARPLVPVTLALMAGIATPAWGLHLPEPWLVAAGVGALGRPGLALVAAASGPVFATDIFLRFWEWRFINRPGNRIFLPATSPTCPSTRI